MLDEVGGLLADALLDCDGIVVQPLKQAACETQVRTAGTGTVTHMVSKLRGKLLWNAQNDAAFIERVNRHTHAAKPSATERAWNTEWMTDRPTDRLLS